MVETEFDKYADGYSTLLRQAIRLSGETENYFMEYKISDTASSVSGKGYPKNLAILDFGCGIGQSVPFFLEEFPKANITCADVSAMSLKHALNDYENLVNFILFDGHTLPLQDHLFHIVFAAGVFHHIPHEKHVQVIREIYRVLKKGGTFILFEHNPKNFLTVRTVEKCRFDEDAILVDPRKIENLIRKCGFGNSILKYRIFFPRLFRMFRPIERFLVKVPFGAQYSISAIKSL